jgi:hypothetical protein
MNSKSSIRVLSRLLVALAAVYLFSAPAQAASWKGIEPFVSKRADVERVLGTPTSDRYLDNGTLQFDVSGGAVTIFFVTPKFVAAKKLSPSLEGTVLQVVLQHTNATDTPETLNVANNSAYEHKRDGQVDVYIEAKEGIAYTFVGGKLKTTRYSYSAEQLQRIQRGK